MSSDKKVAKQCVSRIIESYVLVRVKMCEEEKSRRSVWKRFLETGYKRHRKLTY